MQLENVRRGFESGLPYEVVPYLTCGNKVRISSGPMAGIDGVLTVLRSQLRVGLQITMMNRSVLVEVSPAQLAPA